MGRCVAEKSEDSQVVSTMCHASRYKMMHIGVDYP